MRVLPWQFVVKIRQREDETPDSVAVVVGAVERDKPQKKGDKTEHRIMRLNRFSYNFHSNVSFPCWPQSGTTESQSGIGRFAGCENKLTKIGGDDVIYTYECVCGLRA